MVCHIRDLYGTVEVGHAVAHARGSIAVPHGPTLHHVADVSYVDGGGVVEP